MTVYKVVHFRGFVVGRDFECTQNIGRSKPTRLTHTVQMVMKYNPASIEKSRSPPALPISKNGDRIPKKR
jgi:hypothetical protein